MRTYQSLVLKKSDYGEADLLITLFSREAGKFRAVARNAKKSRKRFGGLLDFFNHLTIDITEKGGRFSISDVTLRKSYREVSGSVDLFLAATRVLEMVDYLTPEREPDGELFDLALTTLGLLAKEEEPRPVFFLFMLHALKLCGYAPDLRYDGPGNIAGFDIASGKLCDRKKNTVYNFYTDVLEDSKTMEAQPDKVKNNIQVLIRYAEYQTGNRFRKRWSA